MKENAVYFLLDWNKFSQYALIFPTSQSKCTSVTHKQSKFVWCHNHVYTVIETHRLTNETASTVLTNLYSVFVLIRLILTQLLAMNSWEERNLIGPAADIEPVEEGSIAGRPGNQHLITLDKYFSSSLLFHQRSPNVFFLILLESCPLSNFSVNF